MSLVYNSTHACLISALSVTNTLAVLILAFFMARQQQPQQHQVKRDTLGTLPSTAGVDTLHARLLKDISPQQTIFFCPPSNFVKHLIRSWRVSPMSKFAIPFSIFQSFLKKVLVMSHDECFRSVYGIMRKGEKSRLLQQISHWCEGFPSWSRKSSRWRIKSRRLPKS